MSDLDYLCPQCRTTLAAVAYGDFDTWECKDGHGVGITLTEAYGHFQEDEIRAIWQAAKSAPQSSLRSPALGQPMVAVTVAVDDDEVEGSPAGGSRLVTLDVAPDEQFLWFHVVDFKAMPADLPNPAPSADELAKLEQIRAQSREAIAADTRRQETPESEFGYRVGSKAAALLNLTGFMKKLGAAARKPLERR